MRLNISRHVARMRWRLLRKFKEFITASPDSQLVAACVASGKIGRLQDSRKFTPVRFRSFIWSARCGRGLAPACGLVSGSAAKEIASIRKLDIVGLHNKTDAFSHGICVPLEKMKYLATCLGFYSETLKIFGIGPL
jgi:hypothetical protein